MSSKYFDEYKKNPIYTYMMGLMISSVVGLQVWQNLFTNYAVDAVGLTGFQVSQTQSIRELAGFLTFLVIYILMIMKEKTLAASSVLLIGIALAFTGLIPNFEWLLLTTFISSIGFHFFETTNQSLILQSFGKEQTPVVLGKFRSFGAITNVIVGGTLIVAASFLAYKYVYILYGSLVALVGAFFLIFKKPRYDAHPQKRTIMLKKKYWLYYSLNFLVGARRQIFVVFAPLLLVQKYGYEVQMMTALFMINNVITFIIGPKVGRLINKMGERKLMTIEYASLVILFIAYATINNPWVVAALYIIDQMFFSFSMSINTYFQKNADPSDIAPSMATGFAINHIMAVLVPLLGGFLWEMNWRSPFFIGAGIGVLSLFFAQKVKIPKAGVAK